MRSAVGPPHFSVCEKNAFLFGKIVYNNYCYAGVVKLVDTIDSKSIASDGVPVRVRPPVPY